MAATITLMDNSKAEVPGIFNYIVTEMLKANNIPEVKSPDTVTSGYKTRGDGKRYDNTKEREKKKIKISRKGTDSTRFTNGTRH